MKMNKEKLHRTSVSYIENFLDDVRHIKNRVLVKNSYCKDGIWISYKNQDLPESGIGTLGALL